MLPGAMRMPRARAAVNKSDVDICAGNSSHRHRPPLGRLMRVPTGKWRATSLAMASRWRLSCCLSFSMLR